MNISTIIDKRNMRYDYYIKQPKEMLDLKYNRNVSKNAHLRTSPERSFNYPLLRKLSKIPFDNH